MHYMGNIGPWGIIRRCYKKENDNAYIKLQTNYVQSSLVMLSYSHVNQDIFLPLCNVSMALCNHVNLEI